MNRVLYSSELYYEAENVIIDGEFVKSRRTLKTSKDLQDLLDIIKSGEWKETTLIQDSKERTLHIYITELYLDVIYRNAEHPTFLNIRSLLGRKIFIHFPNSSVHKDEDIKRLVEEYLIKKKERLGIMSRNQSNEIDDICSNYFRV